MKVHRVHVYSDCDGSFGYKFFTDMGEAKSYRHSVKTDDRDIRTFDFPLTKAGVMRLLGEVADHPDNG